MAGFTNTDNFFNPSYATPQQIEAQRQYAKALLEQSQMPVTGGRTGWAQGVNNLVSALMSGVEARRADVSQQRSRQMDIASILGAMQPQQPSASSAPSSPPSQFTGDQNNPFAGAISNIESGGRYDILGPVTKTGDRAYGKYQVMGNNIGPWTKELLGQEMTPQEFLANPQAQDAVFKGKFGQYAQKYGPEGAARAWFAGEGNMNNLQAKDQLGTTVGDYGQRFMAGLPQGAMAFNGPQVPTQNAPQPVQSPQGAPITSPQPPVGLNTGLLAAALGAQNLDPRMTAGLVQMAMPQMIDGPGGKYARDPVTGRLQFVLPELQKGKFKTGDTEFETSSVYDPATGKYKTQALIPGAGPQGQAGSGPLGAAQPIIEASRANAVERARQEKVAEEGGKAQMVPIAETMKEARTAPQAINALNIIENTAQQYGDKITTGGAADAVLKLKQTVNGLVGGNPLGDTAPAELIKKMNAQLASAALPAFTNRGTQFDLKVFMDNNPGLSNSIQGTLFLTNILKQIHGQQLELSKLASNKNNWENWPAVQEQFYKAHPLMNPLTGKELSVTATEPSNQTNQQNAPAGPPQAGQIVNGFRFKGGNPYDSNAWEKAQ